MIRAISLVKRCEHHTASGGYDRLAQEVGSEIVGRPKRMGLGHRLLRKWWDRRHNPEINAGMDYGYGDWVAEWQVVLRSMLRPPDVVHVLYGEDQANVVLRYRRWLRCPLVASVHYPPSKQAVLLEKVRQSWVDGMDAVITVSKSQLTSLRSWLGEERVVYVPHGIDTARFCPGPRTAENSVVRLAAVGDHMRDWNALHRIADECQHRKLPVEFDVVVQKQYAAHFTGCANVRVQSGVSEETLIELYRTSNALVFPVTDATANNALLESLACGTPVITNLVGGIGDYVDDSCAWLFEKGEVTRVVDLIQEMSRDHQLAFARREAARRQALKFDWSVVVARVRRVYEAVIRRQGPASTVGDF